MNLEKLFKPKKIAIIGASEEAGKIGRVLVENITKLGYSGEVFFVNPKHQEISGKKCYAKLSEIEAEIDLAILSVPAKFVQDVVVDGMSRVKNFVIISAGFSETGEEGKKKENELLQIAKENELNILGPNCLGFIVPGIDLNASFAGGMPKAGNVAFVSQSGALAVAIMDIARRDNIKFSHIISVGNKMQIDEAELLEFLDKDEKTKVIAMYLEGIKDGMRFMQIARKVSKPIVILKAGKTEKSQKAIASHTGALAGSDDVMTAVFEQTGILRAENMDEFFSLIKLISSTDVPIDSGVAVITNAGGPGVLTTDAFKGAEIQLVNLSQINKNELREFLPEESSVENPIDLLGDATDERYEKALNVLGKIDEISSIVCVLTPQDQTPVEKIADKLIEFKKKTDKIVATIFIGGERVESSISKLSNNSITNFSFPDQAVKSLNDYYNWGVRNKKKSSVSVIAINETRKKEVVAMIEKARIDGRTAMSFAEASKIMEMYGVKCINIWGEGELSEITYPAVIKVDSDKVLHKTDKQGLILGIKNEEKMLESIAIIKNNFPGENFIIQPMLERKTELIIGIKQDSIFGPIIVFGLGGIYTEIFKMVDFLLPTSDKKVIKEKILESKIKFLFQETRGQKMYNLDEFSNILCGVSFLAQEISEISEFDINPILVYNDGKEAVAVDVKIVI
jgi:acetyltransferase